MVPEKHFLFTEMYFITLLQANDRINRICHSIFSQHEYECLDIDLDFSNKSKTGPGIKGVTTFLLVYLYPYSLCTSRLGQLMWGCWDEGTPSVPCRWHGFKDEPYVLLSSCP